MATVRVQRDLADVPFMKDEVAPAFKIYIENRKAPRHTPSFFGKDSPLKWPQRAVDAEIWHMHLNDEALGLLAGTSDPARWNNRWRQSSRCSDCYLIYTRGISDPDTYILLAVIRPNAHDKLNDVKVFDPLIEMAEAARRQF